MNNKVEDVKMKKVVLLVLIFICILSMTSCIGRNWVLLDTYKEGIHICTVSEMIILTIIQASFKRLNMPMNFCPNLTNFQDILISHILISFLWTVYSKFRFSVPMPFRFLWNIPKIFMSRKNRKFLHPTNF